jgi:outer membrane protein TolC
MRTVVSVFVTAWLLAATSVSGQTPAPAPPDALTRRLSVEEAVRLALENNLGIQIARINPEIQDLTLAVTRASWAPTFTTSFQDSSTDSPATSFLSGGQEKTSDDRLTSSVGIQQALKRGGNYSFGWDNSRSTTTNLFSNFSPQTRSALSLHVEQPLARNFGIDSIRQQLLVNQTSRDISDIDLQQTLATTTRSVRNAYWDLAYALTSLQVQQQSLELAQESLRNTQARVNIGTTPPIDIVEAESEVATRQEAVILAQSQIEEAEDTLRALIFNPSTPDFWTLRIEPSELPAFQPASVNVDAVVRSALERRTDLRQSRKTLEANDVTIRYFRNQILPDVTASVDYGVQGTGGTQFVRGAGFPGPITGQSTRGFGTVLGDIFTNAFPAWTVALNVSYPLGHGTQEANLARARLQYSQAQTQIRSQELQVTSQVRSAARQVATNEQRVQTTRVSRELAERRLDAEQRKFAAGTSTSFIVFQVQRDLAQARNNELRAILDFNRSLVDLDTVQQAPIAGGTGGVSTISAGTTAAGR